MQILEKIFEWNLPPKGQHLLNIVLLWIGFSIVVGICAQILVPGKRMRGMAITFLVGLTGSCLGSMGISLIFPDRDFNPIGLAGFLAALITSVALLILAHFFMLIFPARTEKNEQEKSKE
ncbi:MAG: hypothetical protein Q4G69_06200 [Planctomycetia bacterium]|nr:hypothetical protein [Planctomycetia bacterium]